MQASPPGSFTVSAVARCDTTSPVAPAIKLTWTASSGATSYDVYRNGSLYTTITGTTYDNTANVVAGQTYSYYVVAKNASGTTQTNTVSVPVSSAICGSAPGSFTVSAVARCDTTSPVAPAIKLTWTASSGATSYDVYRNGSLYTTITGTTYDNTANVVAGQTYSYYVVAKNANGTTQTNTVSVPVSSAICGSAPGSFTVSAVARCDTTSPVAPAIKLTWTASSGATSYDVYRNGLLYTTITSTSYDNTANVSAGQTYTYYVVAKNSTGTTQSNTLSVPVASNICGSGNLPGSFTVSAVARCDTTSPVAPAIKLTWTASSGATSYDVYRNGLLYTTITSTSYDNTANVSAGQTYTYYVVAKNSTGTTQSNTLSVPVASNICGNLPGSFTVSAVARCDTTSPVAPAIKLTWTASSGATSYDVYRNGTLYTTITSTAYDNTANVVSGQTYSYYVVAKNASGTTQSNTMTVPVASNICSSGSPPGSFTVSAVARCDTTSPVAPAIKLTWTASSGATSYDVYRNGSLYTTITGASYDNQLNVVAGQTYTYYVVAKNANGTTQSNTESVPVATNICGSSSGSLSAPTLSSPSNAITGVTTTPTFIWNPVVTGTSYRIMIATDPAQLPTADTTTCSGCTYNNTTFNVATSFTPSSGLLSTGTTYYWQVRAANDAHQISPWSQKWSFTTASSPATLPAPTLTAPTNGSTNQSTLPTFSWLPVTGASDYRLMIAANQSDLPTGDVPSCNNCINKETLGAFFYTPQAGALSAGTTYYWQVRAATSSGVRSPWSQWSFTTAASSTVGTVSNGGFEQGDTGWTKGGGFHISTDKTNFPYPHSNSGYAWFAKTDGTGGDNLNGSLNQTFIVPSAVNTVTLSFWYNITSQETANFAKDVFTVMILDATGAPLPLVKTFSNLDKQTTLGDYRQVSFDLTSYRGQTIQLKFIGTTDGYAPTVFRIDDVSINTSLTLPTISGTVTYNGIGLTGVSLGLSDGATSATATTNASGGYSFPNLNIATYTIVPVRSGYTFNPPSPQLSVVGVDLKDQNFKACYDALSLSGAIVDKTTGSPLPGVTVTVDNTVQRVTDSNGAYEFPGLTCGAHTVSITAAGYQAYNYAVDISATPFLDINLTKTSTVYGPQADSGYAADPVNTATGNYIYQRKDLEIPGRGIPFAFERNYNSQAAAKDGADGSLGFGWTHSYDIRLALPGTITHGDGRTETWTPDGLGGYTPQYGVFDTLLNNGDGTYTLKKKDLTRYNFDASGRLASIADKNGNSVGLTYTGSNLTRVTDTVGREIVLAYNASNRITTITDPINRTVQFTYDGTGNLVTATDMNGNATIYTYDASHQMLTVVDPRGNTVVSNVYDDQERVVNSQRDAKLGQTSYLYNESTRETVITDQLNNNTYHYHDELLRLIQEKDPRGDSTYYTYDSAGNRTEVKDKNGNTTTYAYDTNGNVISKIDSLDNVTTITYDANNNPLSRTDALGKITAFEYDSNGNLSKTIDPLGHLSVITYNGNGQPLTVTDPRGKIAINSYDGQGNLLEVADPLGNKTTFTYDGAGRRLTAKDALSRVTTYVYDNNNNLLTATDPLGNVVSSSYDGNNNRLTATDAKGNVTAFAYDVKDLLVTTTDSLGKTMTMTYDPLDRRTAVTDKLGNSTNFTYDAVGNLLAASDPLGNTTSSTYDANGNKLTASDPLGNQTTFIYDELNRVIGAKDPLGNIATTSYDQAGRVVATTNAKGQTTAFEYDALGRLTKVTDANNGTVTYSYDANGNRLATTNAKGQTTAFEYDALGRLTKVTDANNGTVTYSYDANGNRLAMTDPNGNTTTYAYDALNRLVTKTEPLGVPYSYVYDAVGNMTTLTDPKGQTTTYAYDALNRLQSVTYPDSSTVTYSYDANANRTAMTDSLGTTAYQYDILNRLTGYSDPFGKNVGYGYDANGNRVTLTYPDGKIVTYSYDAASRLTSVKDWGDRTTTYAYDVAGRLTTTTNANGTVAAYTYDNAGRLTGLINRKADNTVISSYSYTLDAIGNHLQVEQQEPLFPGIPAEDTSYTYDADNRVTSVGAIANTFDANGNLTAKGSDTYTYDFNDWLIASTIGGVASQYSYDGQGNRLKKTSGGMTIRYALDVNGKLANVLAETDGTGAITAYYVHGLGLISKVLPGGAASTYHYDSRGSTIALTNAGQNVTDAYAYDTFGSVANSNGTTQNFFRYVGRFGLMDEGNGLTYVRARYYSPGLGRFITKDPLTGKDGDSQSLNRYVYALNNPLRLVDISGFSAQEGIINSKLYNNPSDIDPFHIKLIDTSDVNLNADSTPMIIGATTLTPASFDSEKVGNGLITFGKGLTTVASGILAAIPGVTLAVTSAAACYTGVGCAVTGPGVAYGVAMASPAIIPLAYGAADTLEGISYIWKGVTGRGKVFDNPLPQYIEW